MDNQVGCEREHYHFIGIGGIGMSGLAQLLLERGCQVSGSDLSGNYVIDKLKKRGANIFQGHAEGQVPDQAHVIYNTDIQEINPEMVAARKKGLPLLHRSDLLGMLTRGHRRLAVTGTHGKTTTSALLAHGLLAAHVDVGFAIGGTLLGYDTHVRAGSAPYFVVESDESDGTFLKHAYEGAIVTNIDSDHLAYFGSFACLEEAFSHFVAMAPKRELLFFCQDDPSLSRMCHQGVSYGFSGRSAVRGSNVRAAHAHMWCDIDMDGRRFSDVEVSLAGHHNVLNALAVFGMLSVLGVPEEAIRKGLRTFGGVKRRMEKRGMVQGALIVDDYAHHPTEIAATLAAQRAIHPEAEIIAVFQPHRYSRLRYIMDAFTNCFVAADHLIVTDIYTAGEAPVAGITTEAIIAEIQKTFRPPIEYIPRKEIARALLARIRPGNVVITMGAGDSSEISREMEL